MYEKKRAHFIFGILFLIIYLVFFSMVVYYYISQNRYIDFTANRYITLNSNDEELSFYVTVKNKNIYAISSENNFYLSYHILNEQKEAISYENIRTNIPDIKPGRLCKIKLNLDTLLPGSYILEIDVVKENEYWFKSMGNKPFLLNLTIK